jgi:hypothetical protein
MQENGYIRFHGPIHPCFRQGQASACSRNLGAFPEPVELCEKILPAWSDPITGRGCSYTHVPNCPVKDEENARCTFMSFLLL